MGISSAGFVFSPSNIVLYALFIFIALFGIYVTIRGLNSPCYTSLRHPDWLPDRWMVAALLIVVSVISLVGLWLAYPMIGERGQFFILLLFVFNYLFFVLWSLSAFSACSLVPSVFLMVATIASYIIVIPYLLPINWQAAVMQIPYILILIYLLIVTASYVHFNQ